MLDIDLYAVLGIPPTATAAEIKGAYRRLAHLYHPDKNPGNLEATHRFRAVVEAYETLRDPSRRAAYDRQGPLRVARAHQPFRTAPFPRSAHAPKPEAPSSVPGQHVHLTTVITLSEVLQGTERTLQVERNKPCNACQGSGAARLEAWTPCARCRGAGRLHRREGAFAVHRLCPDCHGAGQQVAHPCRACGGRSLASSTDPLRVRIPSGIESGTIIRYARQGHAGRFNGPRGDLYLTVNVAPHSAFTREGADLWRTLRLTPAQAALGALVPTDLLDGPTKIRVKPGTRADTSVRLAGRGLPVRPGAAARGNCYLRFTIEVPAKLSRGQRRLYEQLLALEPPSGGPDGRLGGPLLRYLRRLFRR